MHLNTFMFVLTAIKLDCSPNEATLVFRISGRIRSFLKVSTVLNHLLICFELLQILFVFGAIACVRWWHVLNQPIAGITLSACSKALKKAARSARTKEGKTASEAQRV